MQNLGAAEVKTFFDWIEKKKTLEVLWKQIPPLVTTGVFLKGLYYEKTFRTLDEATIKDSINVISINLWMLLSYHW
jgi:hypothetical protein